MPRMQTTSITLLERLRNPADQEAWNRFVRLYTPLLFHWGRRCGLQADDAADLIQDVLVTLFQKLPEFTYERDKSFRAWLRTVTLNRWRDRQRRLKARLLPVEDIPLATVPGPDHAAEFEEAEYRTYLVSVALQLVQNDFEPQTWQAFWQFAVEGRPVAEVAAQFGLTPTSVYGAKFRILSRLRQELHGFLD
jgi:RNA polymerase sigma-70 factor (ECF subfamily)